MPDNHQLARVLTGLRHGEHAKVETGTDPAATPLTAVVQAPTAAPTDIPTTPFDYLFRDITRHRHDHLAVGQDTVQALHDLGMSMVEAEPQPGDPPLAPNSTIPTIYTYWGQFVDHDLTANTDRDGTISIRPAGPLEPVAPDHVRVTLGNLRNPALNLDSVYGDGPFAATPEDDGEFVPYDGIKLRVGDVAMGAGIPGVQIPPLGDRARDLPRRQGDADPAKNGVALVGDGRNDENLILAQLHVAFLRFHNAAVDWVRANEPDRDSDVEVFLRARDLTRWSYQWVVVHDFLPTVTAAGVVDAVLASDDDLLDLAGRGTYMPLEFSVAAFRYGHSMVRAAYDWNRNFGQPGNVIPTAPFNFMFQFTGKHEPKFDGNHTALPFNWVAEWERMVDKASPFPFRFARPIDTHIVPPLAALANEGNDPALSQAVSQLLKQLAVRNLLRGYRLSLPTGQAVATQLGIAPLSKEELETGTSEATKTALTAGGFVDRTPLWFYILKEAEVRAGGNSLGPVGSTIVAATIIGQIRHDPTSYVHQSSWSPAAGVRLADASTVRSIKDFLRFAGVLH